MSMQKVELYMFMHHYATMVRTCTQLTFHTFSITVSDWHKWATGTGT